MLVNRNRKKKVLQHLHVLLLVSEDQTVSRKKDMAVGSAQMRDKVTVSLLLHLDKHPPAQKAELRRRPNTREEYPGELAVAWGDLELGHFLVDDDVRRVSEAEIIQRMDCLCHQGCQYERLAHRSGYRSHLHRRERDRKRQGTDGPAVKQAHKLLHIPLHRT